MTRAICGWLCLAALTSGVDGLAADRVLTAAIQLKTPRKKPPRQGGPLDKVELAIWLPDVKVVRGAVVNPFYLKAVGQEHWRAAARQWGFAIVAANYFGVRNTEFASTLKAALVDFARQSGRKELAHLPLCFVGMSAGGGMSVRLAEQMPERTIAAAPVCLEVGPRSAASREIPIVTIFGEKDGRQREKLLAKLPVERKARARWAIAVQWGRRHEFARANNLAMVWFDRAIAHRYPPGKTPLDGPLELRPIDESSGWTGDVGGWGDAPTTISAAAKPNGGTNCWLPDQYTAAVWQAFVIRRPAVRIVSPAGMGDGQPFRTWPADKPIDVTVKLRGVESRKLELFDGHEKIAESKTDGMLRVAGLKPGIHALIAVAETADGKRLVSHPNTIVVAGDR